MRTTTLDYTVQGKPLRLYSPLWLYTALGVSRRTYLRWRKLGFFPNPVFAPGSALLTKAWYCADEITEFIAAFRSVAITAGKDFPLAPLRNALNEAVSRVRAKVQSSNFSSKLQHEDYLRQRIKVVRVVRKSKSKLAKNSSCS